MHVLRRGAPRHHGARAAQGDQHFSGAKRTWHMGHDITTLGYSYDLLFIRARKMFERFRQYAPHSSPTFLCAKAPSDVNGHRSRCESKTSSNTSCYTARSNMHTAPYLELHRRQNDRPNSPRGHVPPTAAARDPRACPRQQSRHHQQASRDHSPW